MAGSKLPEATVVRIIKCLSHGCSVEATADICKTDVCTVDRLLEMAGRRVQDFHNLQLEKLKQSIEAVELDELHTRVSGEQKRGRKTPFGRVVGKVGRGFTRLWNR